MGQTGAPLPELEYELVALPRWGWQGPAVRPKAATGGDDAGKLWFPVAAICGPTGLGIQPQMQLARLRNDGLLSGFLRLYPIPTRAGVRNAWCIREDGLAGWLGSIDVARVRPELRADLTAFRLALIEEAHRLLFPDRARPRVDEPEELRRLRTQFARVERQLGLQGRFALTLEERLVTIEQALAVRGLPAPPEADEGDPPAGMIVCPVCGGEGHVPAPRR